MSDYVVSARKYRPSSFEMMVGQDAITTTLKNAIRSKHLAQAFLFCGPRGVGKTTCARILAKTINCTNLTPQTEACNQCDSCLSFINGQSLNIYELDAASNNSVEDIRSLVEQVRYPPQAGAYKIYIIDEVHMLSLGAFNAFLKTLEEPPPYAIFILATTEKHKIIPTILSRCQIFDFNRIRIEDMTQRLAYVAQQEQVEADADALHIIAQKADGSLRDALSVFDQIVSFAGNKISYKDVIANLNILDYDYYFRITGQVASGDLSGALLTFNELLNDGFDGHHFINGFGKHLRDLLVCSDAATLPLLEVSQSLREKYARQSQQLTPALICKLLETVNTCDVEYRQAKNQRLHVELTLIRMCRLSAHAPAEKKNDSVTAALADSKPTVASPPSKPVVQVPPSKPAAPVVNEPRMAVLKTPSISAELASVKKETAETSGTTPRETELQAHPFSTEELLNAWNEYAQKMQQAGRRNLFAALNKRKPVVKENFLIDIAVDNAMQADEIKNERPALLAFLRSTLKNAKVEVAATVLEAAERTDDAYTPAEKFQKMAEKNPSLEKLRRQFDLEF